MIVLYNMDCMEAMKKMKDNEFDLAIVDPPYGIGIRRHKNKKARQTNNGIKKINTPKKMGQ
jgi:site-specific DNA-methyltransferase (adenine-specific)